MREGITPIQAGTVSINPCTAYRMLRDFTTLNEGEWFIQNGANSGVGRAAIQLGKKWGYKSVNIIRSREDKAAEDKLREELLDIGADVVITDAELQSQGIKDMSKEWTNGGREPIRLGLNCVNGKACHRYGEAALIICTLCHLRCNVETTSRYSGFDVDIQRYPLPWLLGQPMG